MSYVDYEKHEKKYADEYLRVKASFTELVKIRRKDKKITVHEARDELFAEAKVSNIKEWMESKGFSKHVRYGYDRN